jgi:hypothetical protein
MLRFCCLTILAAVCAHSLNAQVGCAYYDQGCNDPVPLVDITDTPFVNDWVDTEGCTWSLTSTDGTVSGNVTCTMPSGCPSVTFIVTGDIYAFPQIDGTRGSTSFAWTGSNPQPPATCGGITPVSSTYSGTIQNISNSLIITAAWKNVTGESGWVNVMKSPADFPASETTTAVGFGGSGVYVSVGQFRQILNAVSGSTDIFKGRQVSEQTGWLSPYYDNCYYSGSAYPKWTTVDGSGWNVGYYPVDPPYIVNLNVWADDYIGYPYTYVTGYRNHYASGSPLCGARIPQVMYIGYSTGWSEYMDFYAADTVGEDIYRSSVTAYRAGVSQTNNK